MLEKLKLLKEKSGMSYPQIAEKSGIPESTITRIFSGKTTNPTISTFIAIVKAMGGKAADVFDDDIRMDLDPSTPEQIQIIENKVEVVESIKESSNDFHRCHYHSEFVDMYKTAIGKKDKLIKALLISFASVIGLILILLLFDVFNPGIGYIRR